MNLAGDKLAVYIITIKVKITLHKRNEAASIIIIPDFKLILNLCFQAMVGALWTVQL